MWGREVPRVCGSGPGRKIIKLNRKTQAHLVGSSVVQSRPRVWKRFASMWGIHVFSIPDRKRRAGVIRMMGDTLLLRSGTGVD